MQIYEITKPESAEVKEGIGKLGGALGSVAAGIGKSLYQKATNAVLPGTQSQQGQYVSPGSRQAMAMKMLGPAAQALSKKAQEIWVSEVQNMLATSEPKVFSASMLKRPEVDLQLQGLINSLAGFDVLKNFGNATDDPTGQKTVVADEIEKAREEIVSITVAPKPNPAALKTSWDKLALLIAQAQNTNQFAGREASTRDLPDLKPDGRGGYTVDGMPYNPANPIHQQAMLALKKSLKIT